MNQYFVWNQRFMFTEFRRVQQTVAIGEFVCVLFSVLN